MDHHDGSEDAVDLAVYLALLALTGATLGAALLGGGRLMAVSGALIIASAKASLIGFYYMDLRRERGLLIGALAVSALAVAVLFLGLLPDLAVFPR